MDQKNLNINEILYLVEKKVGNCLESICTRDNFLNRTSIMQALRSTITKLPRNNLSLERGSKRMSECDEINDLKSNCGSKLVAYALLETAF